MQQSQQLFQVDSSSRPNIYNIVREKREESATPITRLLYVAVLIEPSDKGQKFEIEELISKWIRTNSEKKSQFTGYLQIKGNQLIHFLEAESSDLNRFLMYLYNEFNQEKSIYTLINIIAFNEENPQRFYESWTAENPFSTGAPVMDSDRAEQQIIERQWQVYELFCKAGSREKDPHRKLFNEVVISNEDMFMFTRDRYMTINEYKELYIDDLEIDLENEHIYPYNPNLTRLLEYSDIGELTSLIS